MAAIYSDGLHRMQMLNWVRQAQPHSICEPVPFFTWGVLLFFFLVTNRVTECRPNPLLRATSPTFVKARILDEDRQVITAAVMAGLRAGRAATDVVPADLSHLAHLIQNPELQSHCSARTRYCGLEVQPSLALRDIHFLTGD